MQNHRKKAFILRGPFFSKKNAEPCVRQYSASQLIDKFTQMYVTKMHTFQPPTQSGRFRILPSLFLKIG
jgi:hypothetical protein